MRTSIIATTAAFLGFYPSCIGQQDATKGVGNLPVVLLQAAKQLRVSVIAEMTEPVPQHLTLPGNQEADLATVMNTLQNQAPGYGWIVKEGVVIFANKTVLYGANDPLDIPLRHYYIPATLADFKMTFPSAVEAAKEGVSGEGGIVNGILEPEQQALKLVPGEVSNETGWDILVRVARQLSPFYSVLVVPSSNEDRSATFRYWDVTGGKNIATHASSLSSFVISPEGARQLKRNKTP